MRFFYTIKTKDGRTQKGFIEANSRQEAFNILSKYDFLPISLSEKKGETFSFSKKSITLKDLVFFTRQLGIMLRSALSPLDALRAIIIQTENPYFREKLFNIVNAIEMGSTISQSFSLYPEIFDQFYLNMIKSGEATGKLSNVFLYLGDHLERNYKLLGKIKSAMIYPVFIIVVLIAAVFLLTFFVLPQLIPLFDTFKEKLPKITLLVISFSKFFKERGWLIFIAIVLAFFIVYFVLRKKGIKEKKFERILFGMPIFGDFLKKIQMARICGNLSALLNAGLPIVQAIKITEEIIQNNTYKDILKETQLNVARGETISSIFSKYPKYISPFVVQMIATGEQSGNIEDLLNQVNSFYEEEVNRFADNLTSLIEPILLIILGIGVGFLVIAIFLPIMQIGTSGFGGM
ncbi:MAG: type II secretion system F family protein [Minisyncoccia bacterium]